MIRPAKHTMTTSGNPSSRYDSAVIGLGETGWSLARFLLAQGEKIVVVDTRQHPPFLQALRERWPQVSVALGGLDISTLLASQRVLVSPGVSLPAALCRHLEEAGIPVQSDIDLFCQHAQAPIIAVTGSNGKSTVTTLLGEMAKQAELHAPTGGNLGPPALDLLAARDVDYYLLELSSFQLSHTHSLNAHAAVILNFSEDHLDRHRDVNDYLDAKRRIYVGDGLMVINADDPVTNRLIEPGRRVRRYSVVDTTADLCLRRDGEGHTWLCSGQRQLIRQHQLALSGVHHVSNALACLGLAESMAIDLSCCIGVLQRFVGLPHRCQALGTHHGLHWYDDSKATNVAATCAAVRNLATQGAVVLIAGGCSKGSDMRPLAATLVGRVRHAVLFGQDAPLMEEALSTCLPCTRVRDMQEAVRMAIKVAKPGQQVLLSPACASLDQYTSYRHRGEDFAKQLQALTTRGPSCTS